MTIYKYKYLIGIITSVCLITQTFAQSSTFTFKQQTLFVEEGNAVRVTVIAPANLERTTRIPLRIQAGTARSGTDFQVPANTVLTFYKGGLKEKSLTIRTRTDSQQEESESFTVRLGATGAQVTVEIRDKGAKEGMVTTTLSSHASVVCPTVNPHGLTKVGRDTWYPLVLRQKYPEELMYAFRLGGGGVGVATTPVSEIPFLNPAPFGSQGGGGNEYIALKINTKIPKIRSKTTGSLLHVSNTGELQVLTSTSGLEGPIAISISKCPGDFRDYLKKGIDGKVDGTQNASCVTPFAQSMTSLTWAVRDVGQAPLPLVCNLEPNQEYYVNYTMSGPAGSACIDGGPGTLVYRGCKLIGDNRIYNSNALQAGFNPETMSFEGYISESENHRTLSPGTPGIIQQ
jgi:Calx-beta domain